MENLWIFAVTLAVYFGALYLLGRPGLKANLKRFAILALLCMPLNVNGHVFTVIGNAVGEKGVYSLFSLYQKTDGDAVTYFGLAGYQNAGQNAVTGFGLAGYQNAGQNAMTVFGVGLYQKVEKRKGFDRKNFRRDYTPSHSRNRRVETDQ